MASIQKIKNINGFSYKVFIRNIGLKTIIKTFPQKQLATQFIYQIESDRQARVNYSNSNIFFRELAEEYLNNSYQGSRPKQQRSMVDYWVKELGNRIVLDITTKDIINGINNLSSNLSNSTKNRYKAVISVVLSYAVKTSIIEQNPTLKIASLRENNHRVRYLSNNERKRLYEASRASKWSKLYLLILMAITTGSRKGELMNLRWSDIDLDRQTAYVETTKNGQPKVMPLTDDVVAELGRFIGKESEFIFNSELKPDRPMCFTKQWKKALKLAEIEDFRFHDLRHTTASYLAQNGASLLEIADVLGHKQIQVTKRYAHLCIEHKSSLINRVMSSI